MRTGLPILLSLLASWPVLAQETVPPADPELAALEQEILDSSLLTIRGIDLNYNDRCDPEEKPDLITALMREFGEDCTDFLEQAAFRLPIPRPLSHDDAREFFRDYQKRHPGPIKGRELRQAIEEEQSLQAIAELAGLPRQGDWRLRLLAQLAKEEDANHNGILDHDKLIMRGAIDCILLKAFGATFIADFDRNGDGVLSQQEHDAIASIVQENLDLNGDGNISLDELGFLEYLLCVPYRPPFQGLPASSKAEFAKYNRLLPRYDRNGNGRWQPLELKFAVLTEIALNGFFNRVHDTPNTRLTPFTPETRDAFVKQLLPHRDLNGNGQIDYAEIPYGYSGYIDFGPDPLDKLIFQRLPEANLPPKVLESIMHLPATIQRLSEDPRFPAVNRAEIMQSLLALYDRNHDGRLDSQECRDGEAIEWALNSTKQVAPNKPCLATPEQQRALVSRMMAAHGKSSNNSQIDSGIWAILQSERIWLNLPELNETVGRLDKDGDGWLDANERKPLEAEILKKYDYNHNGALERLELASFLLEESYKKRWFGQIPTPEQQQDWDKHRDFFYFYPNQRPAFMLAMSRIMMFDYGNKSDMTWQDILRWQEYMLKNHDLNGDGRIDMDELQNSWDWSNQWRRLAERRKVPPKAVSMPELQRWALANGDTNHDGKLSLPELTQMNQYQERLQAADIARNQDLFTLQKIKSEHPTMAELNDIRAFSTLLHYMDSAHPEFDREDNGQLDPAERLALATYLLKIGDKNGNGRLEYEECYRLLRQTYASEADADKQEEQERQRRLLAIEKLGAEQARRQQEAKWLKKYDFNGNGKLDLEERTRAEADDKARIVAPAQDE